jgi:hypothetical protein
MKSEYNIQTQTNRQSRSTVTKRKQQVEVIAVLEVFMVL